MTPPCTKTLTMLAGLLVLSAPPSYSQSSSSLSEPAHKHVMRADTYRAEGDLTAAIIEMKNAIQKDPSNAGLRYRLGSLYFDAGDAAAAEDAFERAIQLGMADFSARLALARAWLQQGKYRNVLLELDTSQAPTASDKAAVQVLQGRAQARMGQPAEARDMFQAALEAVPRHSPALANLALLSLREGNTQAAERLLREAEQGVAADRAELLWLRGVIDYERGRYSEAEAAFQASLAESETDPSRWRDLAAAQIELGKYEAAKESLERVLSVLPGEGGAIYFKSLLAFLEQDYENALQLATALTGTPGNWRALYIAGVSAFQVGSYERAREYLSQFVAANPDDAAGRTFLARTLLRMEEPVEAYETLLPLAEGAEGNLELLSQLGTTAVLAGKADDGIAYFDQALALRPEDKTLQARRAAAEIAAGNEEAGIAELERLVAEDAEGGSLDLTLAAAHLKIGAFEDAVRMARGTAGSRSEQSPDALVIEGFGLLGGGEIAAAEEAFRAALRKRPGDQDAQLGLAEVKRSRGDISGAREILVALLETHRDPVKAALNLAVFEDKVGNTEQAIYRLEQALAQHRDDVELQVALARYTLKERGPAAALELLDSWSDRGHERLLRIQGQAELQADRPEAATDTFRRLLGQQPESIQGHLFLAKAYERDGEWAKAAATLESALAIDPQQDEVRIARSRLALLRPDPTREGSRAALDTVLELAKTHPQDPRVVELRGLVAWYIERPTEAIELLSAAHAVLDSPDSAVGLAEIQWLAGKRDEAIETLQTWTEGHPNDNYVRYRLARLQLGARELEAAVGNLERAGEAGTQRPELTPALAWALARLGDIDRAKPYATEAYDRSKTNPLALYAMGRVHLAEGRVSEAVQLLGQAMEQSSRDPYLRLDYARALVEDGQRQKAMPLIDGILAEQDQSFPRRQEAVELGERARR